MTLHISIQDMPRHPASDRRRHGRLRCEGVQTPSGKVLDVSAGGLRIESKWPIRLEAGTAYVLRFRSELTPVFEAPVRVVWVKRFGFRRHGAGFAFLANSGRARRALTSIARDAGRLRLG